jgi:glycosyltransferase involved in cell wall biosynthesis
MAASGISTALNAMLLGKCVIGSEGPGISDVFSDELLTVPPEDPLALAEIIERAWTNEDLRTKTATAGNRHALSLGGEPELYQRIIDQVVCCGSQGRR